MCLVPRVGVWFLILVSGFASGCQVFSGSAVAVRPPEPQADPSYAPVYKKWVRSQELNAQFQKTINWSAVLVSQELREAIGNRWNALRGPSVALPWAHVVPLGRSTAGQTEALGPGGAFGEHLLVVVSLFTPETPYADLTPEAGLWNLTASWSPKGHERPVHRVVRLSQKELLRSLFPQVTPWTQDFLVVLPKREEFSDALESPALDPARSPPVAVPASPLILYARSALAHVTSRW